MNQVPTDKLKPGMVLAKSVFREDGKLIAPCGYILTRSLIARLQKLGRSNFWIHPAGSNIYISQKRIGEQISFLKHDPSAIPVSPGDSLDDTREILNSLHNARNYTKIFISPQVKKLIPDYIALALERPGMLACLKLLKNKDEYIFQNSVDVTACVIACAKHLGMKKYDLEKLVISSLLKDIGLIVLPESLVTKHLRDLTFNESLIYQEHPTFGFAILSAVKEIPSVSSEIVFQHHERQDSAGYPRRLKGINIRTPRRGKISPGRIHPYAEIMAICDSYVELIFPRPNGPLPKTPQHVRRILGTAAGSQLNRDLVQKFIELIPEYPEGSKIIARDNRGTYNGFTGYVSDSNPNSLHHPTIILTESAKNQPIEPVKIDLAQNPNLNIQVLIK